MSSVDALDLGVQVWTSAGGHGPFYGYPQMYTMPALPMQGHAPTGVPPNISAQLSARRTIPHFAPTFRWLIQWRTVHMAFDDSYPSKCLFVPFIWLQDSLHSLNY
eukprot:1232643-Amphidinium_carterae.1